MSRGRIAALLLSLPAHFAGLLLVLACLDIMVQIVARAVMSGGAPAWTEEAARMFLIWIAFFGAAAASIRDEHIRVDVFLLGRRARLVWDAMVELVVLAVTAALLYGAIRLTGLTYGNVLPALGLSGALVYLPVALASAIIAARAVIVLFLIGRDLVRAPASEGTTGKLRSEA